MPEHIRVRFKTPFTQIVTENNFQTARTTAGLFIGPGKRATENGFDPEDIEKFRADFFAAHTLRFLLTRHGKGLISINSDAGQRPILIPIIEEVRITHRIERRRRTGRIARTAGPLDARPAAARFQQP